MNSTNIYEQLKCVSQKLTALTVNDTEDIKNVFNDLRCCEFETMMLYDDIKSEVLTLISEEITPEEFRKKMDVAIEKLIGH